MRSPNNLEFNWEMRPPRVLLEASRVPVPTCSHRTWRRSGFAHWRRKWLRNLPFVITVRSWERSRSERSTLPSPQHCPEGQLSSGGEVWPQGCSGDPTRVQLLWGVTEQAVRQRVTFYSSSIPPKSYILFPFSSHPSQLQQNKDLQAEKDKKPKFQRMMPCYLTPSPWPVHTHLAILPPPHTPSSSVLLPTSLSSVPNSHTPRSCLWPFLTFMPTICSSSLLLVTF